MGCSLDAAELRALGDWPAGLFDRPFWTRTDREPSRGQPPPDLELSAADLERPPTFAAVAPLADGEDGDLLARLLTALAAAAQAGRTLFLIDEPARLARRIAAIDLRLPRALARVLDLLDLPRASRGAAGVPAPGNDPGGPPQSPRTAGARVRRRPRGRVPETIEPRVEPAGWARTLAGWLLRHQDADQADWESTRRRAPRPAGPEGPWADEWLERLFGLPALIRAGAPAPANARAWSELIALAGLDPYGRTGRRMGRRAASEPGGWPQRGATRRAAPESSAALPGASAADRGVAGDRAGRGLGRSRRCAGSPARTTRRG